MSYSEFVVRNRTVFALGDTLEKRVVKGEEWAKRVATPVAALLAHSKDPRYPLGSTQQQLLCQPGTVLSVQELFLVLVNWDEDELEFVMRLVEGA